MAVLALGAVVMAAWDDAPPPRQQPPSVSPPHDALVIDEVVWPEPEPEPAAPVRPSFLPPEEP